MNAINKQMAYEYMALIYASREERKKASEEIEYSSYHYKMDDWYFNCATEYREALGISAYFNGNPVTDEDIINKINDLNLSKTQEIALKKIKRNPAFIRLMGEAALAQKNQLQQLLGSSFSVYSGVTIASDNINEPPRQVPKSTLQIAKEFDSYYEKLDSLLENGAISEEQYNNFETQLDYINNYFTSISRGEQIRFRKVSNKEMEKLQEIADEKGISYDEMAYMNMIEQQETMEYDVEEFSSIKSR